MAQARSLVWCRTLPMPDDWPAIGGHQPAVGVIADPAVVAGLYLINRRAIPRIERWARGARGEERVGAILDELDSPRLARDTTSTATAATSTTSSSDHILVGPGGVLTVEGEGGSGFRCRLLRAFAPLLLTPAPSNQFLSRTISRSAARRRPTACRGLSHRGAARVGRAGGLLPGESASGAVARRVDTVPSRCTPCLGRARPRGAEHHGAARLIERARAPSARRLGETPLGGDALQLLRATGHDRSCVLSDELDRPVPPRGPQETLDVLLLLEA
jgi:hypothetical protein